MADDVYEKKTTDLGSTQTVVPGHALEALERREQEQSEIPF